MLELMLAAVMPLEWSATYGTSVPYELELNPAKLETLGGVKPGTGFAVRAKTAGGEVTVPVATYPGRLPGDLGLRFKVPAGTESLMLEAGVGVRKDVDGMTLDNLFAGALEVSAWTVPERTKATKRADGSILFETKGYAEECVTCEAAVPAALRGKPAKLEMDLESLTPMTWGSFCRVLQFDAAGKELPEDVVDPRWISHMRPQGYRTAYREKGRFHPNAAKVRVSLQLRSVDFPVDAYGLPKTDPDQSRARLVLSHLALRGAAALPFPKLDESNFTKGPSGRATDTAIALGGADERAFFYATHSQASWAQGKDLRDESLNFYPDGAATVEAWFRPDWTAFAKKSRGNPCRLFSVEQNYRAEEWKPGKGAVFELRYDPKAKRLHLDLQDWKGRKFSGSGVAELKDGTWTHVAVQFEPGKNAEVFVGGRKVFETALPGYEVIDLKDESIKCPSDQTHMEFFLGSCQSGARASYDVKPFAPLFEGAADLLRVSSGTRYRGDFTPADDFTVDAATRALFTFDRTFDGRSGGGIGFVAGTTRSMDRGRVARELVIDGKTVQYFPKQIADVADPRKVLNLNNYPDVPQAADFDAAWRRKKKEVRMRPGDEIRLTVPERTATDYVEIENKGTKPLLYPILLGKDDLDVRSFADAADSLAVGNLPDRERANRLFQFVIGASDYFMDHTCSFAPGTDSAREELGLPMVMLNAYCGFECGPLNNLTANLFACAVRCPAGQTGGYGHSFEQVFYDGKNHTYDLANQCFFPAMDNETAACLGESEDETGSHHRIRKSPDHFTRRSRRGAYVQTPGYQEKMGLVLNPGESFRVWFANNGELNDVQFIPPASFGPDQSKFPNLPWLVDYTERLHGDPKGRKIYRVNRFFPDYANGFLEFDGRPSAENPAFTRIEADSFCYAVRSSFPVVWAKYEAELKGGRTAALEISTDRGKTFRPLPAGELRYEVRARYEYLVRVRAPIAAVKEFEAKTEVMVNRRVYPGRLRAGANTLRLRTASDGEAEVTVAWREPEGEIRVEGASSSGFIPGSERQLVVLEPGQKLSLKVTGVSASAKVKTPKNLSASLKNGILTLSIPRAIEQSNNRTSEQFFSSLVIADGNRLKQLTVLVCKGARFVTADRATLAGGAALLAPDASSAQPRVMLKKPDDTATFAFDRLPAGRYMVYQLERFEGGIPSFYCGARPLVFDNPAKPGEKLPSGGPNAIQHDFMDAQSGVAGGRAAFKWDAGSDPRRTYHVSWLSRRYDFPAFDRLTYGLSMPLPQGVEVAAVLVVPDPDEDFICELTKILCGMNCNPWMVK